jgi:hypothetical protein
VIVKEAHARGMRVSGHVPAFMTAEQFVNDGVDEIQHINFLSSTSSSTRCRTPARRRASPLSHNMAPTFAPMVDRMSVSWQRSIRSGAEGLPVPPGHAIGSRLSEWCR